MMYGCSVGLESKMVSYCHGFRIVVLQNLIQQPRPKESCLTSCGMPSGHAVTGMNLDRKDMERPSYHDDHEDGKADDGGDADDEEETEGR